MEEFKKRVEKWKAAAIERRKEAGKYSFSSPEYIYQSGKIEVFDMILKDIDEKQKQETSKERS